jgi:NAD-dependent dihydropyrimidine dehydrogenase PreA subunit
MAPGGYRAGGDRANLYRSNAQPQRSEALVTYVIAEPCVDVMDKACVDVCPVDCIHFEEGVDRILYIDPDECIDCGACEPECPVQAIFTEDALPAQWSDYTELNALWFSDKTAARAQLETLKPA